MTDWNKPTLLVFGPMQDCGCPWEKWQFRGIILDLHFESDGSCDVYADAGDWDQSLTVDDRQKAFDYVDALPMER